MANINYIGTGQNIVWGTGDITSPTGGGVVVSASNRETGETIPVLDNKGIPDGMVIVPGLQEASIECYAKINTAPPAIASVATVGNTNVYVESVESMWEQKGIKKLRLSGKALPV